MARNVLFTIRLDDLEMRQIERAARELGMQKTNYARFMLLNGTLQPQKPQQSESADLGALREMHDMLRDIQESSKESARLFNELIAYLRERQRVPSFYEYRVRCIVENITRRDNESEEQYLLRLARRYYVLYDRWPDPNDRKNFGPVPQGFDPRAWPAAPAQ
jgi:hypothetical protein